MSVRVPGSFRLAIAGVAAAAVLCAFAVVRAITISPLTLAAARSPGVASLAEIAVTDAPVATVPSENVLPLATLELAVDHDPFMPNRMRPAPYRSPDDDRAEPGVVRAEPEADPPPFRVIGTAMIGEAGMALVQPLESPVVEVVRLGDTVHGYRLASVDGESATLVIRSQTFTLGVQPGSQGIVAAGQASQSAQWVSFPDIGVDFGAVWQPGVEGRFQVDNGAVEIPVTPGIRQFGRGRGNTAIPTRRVRPDTSRIELPESNERD